MPGGVKCVRGDGSAQGDRPVVWAAHRDSVPDGRVPHGRVPHGRVPDGRVPDGGAVTSACVRVGCVA